MPVKLQAGIFLIGLLIFLMAGFNYFGASPASNTFQKTSLTERDVAIKEAIQNGRNTYTYTSRFIPGIGLVDDPEAYKSQWEKENLSQ